MSAAPLALDTRPTFPDFLTATVVPDSDIRTAPAVRRDSVNQENAMLLLSEELARSHQAQLHEAAERESRVRRLAAAKRWQRKAQAASRRARAAAALVR